MWHGREQWISNGEQALGELSASQLMVRPITRNSQYAAAPSWDLELRHCP